MKISLRIFSIIIALMLVLSGCSVVGNLSGRTITPSNTIISETRDVSGFSEITMTTFGKVALSQGDTESLTVSGSDNLVPLIKTTVSNGNLFLETTENINVTRFTSDNMLTFTIVVKDLSSLSITGLGNLEMGMLSTPKLSISMSGAGKVQISQLTTDALNINLDGLGSVELSGEAKQATIDISGAGSVKAADLKIQTANVTIPGLGSASLWVTDLLTGNISGAGSVSYYGNPQTNTNSTGLGSFKSLGNK